VSRSVSGASCSCRPEWDPRHDRGSRQRRFQIGRSCLEKRALLRKGPSVAVKRQGNGLCPRSNGTTFEPIAENSTRRMLIPRVLQTYMPSHPPAPGVRALQEPRWLATTCLVWSCASHSTGLHSSESLTSLYYSRQFGQVRARQLDSEKHSRVSSQRSDPRNRCKSGDRSDR
jgi:hypothetical protein